MNALLVGGIATTSVIAAFLFLKFYWQTKDSFFLYFAAAFVLEGLNRVPKAFSSDAGEDKPEFYLVRLLAYALILVAIWQKNRTKR